MVFIVFVVLFDSGISFDAVSTDPHSRDRRRDHVQRLQSGNNRRSRRRLRVQGNTRPVSVGGRDARRRTLTRAFSAAIRRFRDFVFRDGMQQRPPRFGWGTKTLVTIQRRGVARSQDKKKKKKAFDEEKIVRRRARKGVEGARGDATGRGGREHVDGKRQAVFADVLSHAHGSDVASASALLRRVRIVHALGARPDRDDLFSFTGI